MRTHHHKSFSGALQRQRGFTLIEIVVAFAILALSLAAIFETGSGAVQRTVQAGERENALLIAQSVVSQLRITAGPWKARSSGRVEGGWIWVLEVSPFDAASNSRSEWRAFEVIVRVKPENNSREEVSLKSIELARTAP